MKKLFAILAVAAFVFAACGQKKVETPAEEPEAVVEEQAPAADENTEETVEMPVEETPAE